MPHVLNQHGLGIGLVLSSKDSKAPLYSWASYTSVLQAPLTIQVDPAWLLPREDHVAVNKVFTVDTVLQDAKPSEPRAALNKSAPMGKVQSAVAVYIPRCLTLMLLTGVCSPCEVWGILRRRAKKLQISKA